MPPKKDAPPNLTPDKPSVWTEENRKRALELILVRGTPDTHAIAYVTNKWDITVERAKAWIQEIKLAWREEWNRSDARLDERLRGIHSLKSVVKELHDIIHATKKIKIPSEKGGTIERTVYAHEPRIRMEAMAKLTKVEATLAEVVGYAGNVDIPLPPPKEASPMPSAEVPGTVTIEPPPPTRSLGSRQEFTTLFLSVKQEMRPKGERP